MGKKKRHSGFAQFSDDGKRDQFVRAVLDSDADLTSRAYVSGNRPTIVFEKLTAGERERVIEALSGLGRWHEDVQFGPTG
jgi:hypothetical protein